MAVKEITLALAGRTRSHPQPSIPATWQDPHGVQAVRAQFEEKSKHSIWVKPLADGSTAILLFNGGKHAADLTVRWERDLPTEVHRLLSHSAYLALPFMLDVGLSPARRCRVCLRTVGQVGRGGGARARLHKQAR